MPVITVTGVSGCLELFGIRPDELDSSGSGFTCSITSNGRTGSSSAHPRPAAQAVVLLRAPRGGRS
ncbi:hypothetical protein [Nonomuraea sp. SBT364]|uniref:hypothetical protein n=1 Tax=Nonomuraea sp. SBT364 TaxID=1580530 RepID=UPI00066B398F|nr:hypothetical protein [Nonomuraea sp. SBT364]